MAETLFLLFIMDTITDHRTDEVELGNGLAISFPACWARRLLLIGGLGCRAFLPTLFHAFSGSTNSLVGKHVKAQMLSDFSSSHHHPLF